MTSLRCWLIRGAVVALLLSGAAAGVVVREYVGPDRVRELLIHALEDQLPDTAVEVESAGLRLFGGVTATNVTLTRRGEAEPYFAAPSVTLAHDKEELQSGRMVLRKIEIDGPTVRVARLPDGSWSVAGLVKPGPGGRPVPTLVVKNATVIVTDRRPDPLPPVTLAAARFELVNDPLPVIRVDAAFTVMPGSPGPADPDRLAVPVAGSVRFNRADGAAQIRVEVPDLAFTPELAPALGKLHPELADRLAAVTARLSLKADVRRDPGGAWVPDITVGVRDGRYADPALPWPLDQVTATARFKDGKVTVAPATARFGSAKVEASGETVVLTTGLDAVKSVETAVERATVAVKELPLDDELFAKLPPRAGRTRAMLNPVGTIDVTVTVARTPAGPRTEFDVRPHKLAIAYEKFRYPVDDLRGSVKRATAADGADEFQVNIDGTAAGRPVGLVGRVGCDGIDPLIELKLTGVDFPIDAKLLAALPPKYAAQVGRLRPTGRGDFTADIRQQPGVNRCDNTFKIRLYGGAVNPVGFPLPLSDIRGNLVIKASATAKDRPLKPGLPVGPLPDTDRFELVGFTATRAGGKVTLAGADEPAAGGAGRRLAVAVTGDGVPIDADLKAAVTAAGGGDVWPALAPRGTLTFAARVERTESGDGAGADWSAVARFAGPAVTPAAFPVEWTDLAGVARLRPGKLEFGRLTAKHGQTDLAVDAADIRFPADGGVWANVGPARVGPVALDGDVVAALPESVRAAVADWHLTGAVGLAVKHCVVSVPAGPDGGGPVVFWNAEARFNHAAGRTGIAWAGVTGAVAGVGRYDAGKLGAIVGNAWFDTATVGGQPLTDVKLTYRVRPAKPDPAAPDGVWPAALEFPDLTATLFQGTVGGEARVTLAADPRFRLWLTAAGVRVDELAACNKLGTGAELRGLAQGKILLENPADPKTGLAVLTGSGSIDVPNGRLLNLPVLLPLLKLLKLQTPDQTAFEEAHAVFDIRGDRIKITQLDLIGSALSLGGVGELSAAGDDIHLEFYTIWSQALRKWLATPLGDVSALLSGNLFRIEMTKSPGSPMEYKPQMLPVVTDPVKAVAERIRNRISPPPPPGAGGGVVVPATYRPAGGR